MKLRNLALCAALLLPATACKSNDDLMEKSVVLMEGMAKAIESAGDDCGKMADALGAYVSKNEATMKDIKAQAEAIKKDPEKAKEMAKSAEKYKDRLMKASGAVMGMMKCADDPKMKTLQEKFQGLF